MLYCFTREYPIQGRIINASTTDENGELISPTDGIYQFSSQSTYGYYNVTCDVQGHYYLTAFYFRATYRVQYIGELKSNLHDVK